MVRYIQMIYFIQFKSTLDGAFKLEVHRLLSFPRDTGGCEKKGIIKEIAVGNKVLKSNNGYTSEQFKKHMKDQGVIHELHHTVFTNGKAVPSEEKDYSGKCERF